QSPSPNKASIATRLASRSSTTSKVRVRGCATGCKRGIRRRSLAVCNSHLSVRLQRCQPGLNSASQQLSLLTIERTSLVAQPALQQSSKRRLLDRLAQLIISARLDEPLSLGFSARRAE